ncbi:HlyD family efflux transporter periplasmic adaptor subunit [Leptolyngbya sp. CCY15150]|uniref:HlyD family efflux transporter periplasmic adaptor subunit n=1 Tax=Leptolyngbya sp. CCY15150 TaxID=2767772 RepID=UPI001EF38D54|nr:HlyD family efflux transporter periplasmic adaptor subunit [Leptolyngbya sp. CCY15150]
MTQSANGHNQRLAALMASNGNPSPNGSQPPPDHDAGNDNHGNNGGSRAIRTEDDFDQPVILQQTARWSHAIIWGIVGVTTFTVLWAAFARVEEAVPATGKLEPQGAVQDVQAPVNGVVQEILVEDGDRVQQGDVLMRLDTRASNAQLESLQEVKTSLEQENRFYRAQLGNLPLDSEDVLDLDLSPEVLSLTESRSTLIAENQLYGSLLTGSTDGATFSPAQAFRLQALQAEASSRISASQLEVAQLERQLQESNIQLQAARSNLRTNETILNDITPLFEEGGIARLQYTRQVQDVDNSQAEVDRLEIEQERLQFAIAQGQEQFQNAVAISNTDILNRIAENDKRISEINSQLNKAIVENEKRISEIESQLSQTELNLQYQEIRAPIDGIVFDLQAQPQGVVGNTVEPVLKLVPSDELLARVFITNRDIGFVSTGMDVDVRVDSFPFSEFGDIKGEVVWIGSDALPPDQIRQFYSFPATVRLDQQELIIRGNGVPLQSGMSVSANIRTRSRTVLSIFTDLFVRKVESVTTSR